MEMKYIDGKEVSRAGLSDVWEMEAGRNVLQTLPEVLINMHYDEYIMLDLGRLYGAHQISIHSHLFLCSCMTDSIYLPFHNICS